MIVFSSLAGRTGRAESSEEPSADRLADFLRPFESVFRRRDQARWFHVYLRGLLAPGSRKTIEAMVRDIEPTLGTPIGDLSQSIQNFLNQSPWDDRLVWRELRRAAARRLGPGPWIGVIEETGIVKQGQHSVGVQRQYAGDHDRKQNCQVVSLLMGVSAAGAFPLGCRLYLPRSWAGDSRRLDAAGVPETHRAVAGRGQVALGLLGEVESDGIQLETVVAASRNGVPRDLRDGLIRRGGSFLIRSDDDTPVHPDPGHGFAPYTSRPAAIALSQLEPSGAWTAFDGVRVQGQRVLTTDEATPLWAIVTKDADARTHYLGRFPDAFQPPDVVNLFRGRQQSSVALQQIKSQFGLDHFEGRSWRGFHHHASLVALAYGFSFLERQRDAVTRDVIF